MLSQKWCNVRTRGDFSTAVPHGSSTGLQPDIWKGGHGECQQRYTCKKTNKQKKNSKNRPQPAAPSKQQLSCFIRSPLNSDRTQILPAIFLVLRKKDSRRIETKYIFQFWIPNSYIIPVFAVIIDPRFPDYGKVELIFSEGPERIPGKFCLCSFFLISKHRID